MSVINTNYLALVSQNNLNKSQSALGTAIERLSSGMRINSAKDDAAGQAIANRFTANINGLSQASRNANDGISIAQTTEGSLNEINNNLQRIRELSVQAANGSNSDSDLASIQAEIKERLDEINRVSRETQFNGKYVLGDDAASLQIQVGAHDNQRIEINLSRIDASTLGLDSFNVDGSIGVANAAATTANLPAGATDNGDGTYTATVNNTALSAAQALSHVEDGNTVIFTAGTATTYTYDAAAGNFTYADSAVAGGSTANDLTALVADIAGRIGNDTSFNVTFSGTQTNVTVDGSGNITAENGDKLYIEGGQLTAAPVGGGGTQATLSELVELAATTAGAKIEHGDISYTTATAHNTGTAAGEITIGGSAISVADLTALIEGGTATADTTVNIGNAVLGGTITLQSADGVSSNAFTDVAGNLTNQASSTAIYTETDDGGLTLDDKVLYVGANGSLTTEAVGPGSRTENPLAALDAALQQVDDLRSHLGAIQNRFESTIANLNNTVNNLSAARSRIEDADYAVEVSNMTRAQILQQAGTSVLAQANQIPQTVLSLLR